MVKRPALVFSFLLMLLTVGLAFLYRESILIGMGEYLITKDSLEKADAIVVLSGSVPDRILEAVDIYEQGYAPLIVLTKEEEREGYERLLRLGIKIPEGHELNEMIARKLGVPGSSITIVDGRADSTYTEAQVSYDFFKKKDIKSIILVTSKSHTTRATQIFSYVTAGGGIKIITRPSKYDTFNPKKWWKVRNYRRQTLFEYEKFVHYYLIDYIGAQN